MASAALDVRELEVSYGDALVLKRVSLAVAAGEFVALLGPSGCGKTTLLRAVSGFVPVKAGSIAVGGRETRAGCAHDSAHGPELVQDLVGRQVGAPAPVGL